MQVNFAGNSGPTLYLKEPMNLTVASSSVVEEDDKDIDVLLKTFFIFRNKKEIFMSKIFFLNKYRSRLSATSNILGFEWAPLIEDFWYMKPYFLFVYGYKVFG